MTRPFEFVERDWAGRRFTHFKAGDVVRTVVHQPYMSAGQWEEARLDFFLSMAADLPVHDDRFKDFDVIDSVYGARVGAAVRLEDACKEGYHRPVLAVLRQIKEVLCRPMRAPFHLVHSRYGLSDSMEIVAEGLLNVYGDIPDETRHQAYAGMLVTVLDQRMPEADSVRAEQNEAYGLGVAA